MNSRETVSEQAFPQGTAEAKAVRPVGSGLDRPTGETEIRESHMRKKQAGRTWHRLFIISQRRHSDWRLSVRPPLLHVLSISVWQ